VCGTGYSEQQFVAKVNNIPMLEAGKLLAQLNDKNEHDWFVVEKANLWANEDFIKHVEKLGLSRETMEEYHLGITTDALKQLYLGVPVFFDGVLMDVRSYNLLKIKGVPKWQSRKDAQSGFIVPYDKWHKDNAKTYLLEGEKDMLIARENGINAVTMTGGAGATPNEFVINAFKDREVVICFDNDEAGMKGMRHTYAVLKPFCKSVRYLDISAEIPDHKGDVWDFFMKHGKSAEDFYMLPEKDFTEEDEQKAYTPIRTAMEKNLLRQNLLSIAVVSAEFEDSYAVPTNVSFKKGTKEDNKSTLFAGETRSWFLGKENAEQMLELIEVSAEREKVIGRLRSYVGIPKTEGDIETKTSDFVTVYKSRVIDAVNAGSFALDVYTFSPVEVGKKYEMSFRVYPHPTKNQKLVAVATLITELDSKDSFRPNPELLKQFQSTGTVDNRLQKLFKSARHHVAKHLDYDLWLTTDLVFNSVLEFDYGERIRGALDVFILGDTQVGKSETTGKLVDLYDFGHFLSLKTSTTVGLIGGSTKIENSWANTIGAIPRQHQKLVVMEEFSGAQQDFIKKMTDIRSSGWLRLARAAGELSVPCRLRMITISNPINDANGNPRFLSSFPNGILPLMELVRSAEDVARYDGFFLISKPDKRVNPFSVTLDAADRIPSEAYRHKIQWVYTRTPDDVIFEEGVKAYIWERASDLNALFESNFPLFGVTTSLKLARFSVALAALLVSTDATFKKVIVTKEIVDSIVSYFKRIYDNSTFKLREYKKEFESYNTFYPDELINFQDLYGKNATLFEFLNGQASTSRSNLKAISGLEGDRFNPLFNHFVMSKWIRLSGETVFPTEKFRIGMTRINKIYRRDTGIPLVATREG